MQKTRHGTPMAFKIALINLTFGVLGCVYYLFSDSLFTSAGKVSIGLVLLGIGEFINNPQVNVPGKNADVKNNISHYFYRKRNVCSLGNLFDIAGILMITTGIASLLF